MNADRFLYSLPGQYVGWRTDAVRERDPRFADILQRVHGMTTGNVLALLNLAVACLDERESYLEIGSFRGATLIGALHGQRNRKAIAVDNFSEFNVDGANEAVLHANLAAFSMHDRVEFHNRDFRDCLVDLRSRESLRVGVYLYDGAHDYRSQLLGLLLAVPLLAPHSLIVIDDANVPAARDATHDFLLVEPRAHILLDLPTPGNCHPTFWNGLLILAFGSGE